MKCPNCGAQNNGSKFCQYCGAMQDQPSASRESDQPKVVVVQAPPQTIYVQTQTPPPSPPSPNPTPQVPVSGHKRWVAFFLCLFLGLVGAHKFYVGKCGMGFLYFITVGLFGIGWFVDLLVIASGSSTDKWGRRLV